MVIKLQGFGGEIPMVEPFYLPQTAAVDVMDAFLQRGSLTPFREAGPSVFEFPTARRSIYLHGIEWLGWDHDVDVVPGPVATDRLYITHANGPPTMRIDGVDRPLRLPNPTTRPTITLSGTLDEALAEEVIYAFTFVTSLGEESGPSPLSNSLLWSPGCLIEVSGLPIVAPVADRLITKKRIYRAMTSASGATELYFVAEINLTDGAFQHDLATHPIAEAITTKEFDPVPSGLRGLTGMPNGIMAGFAGKELFFCEPYQPHAWPGAYSLALTDTIIGLAAFGTTLAVLTTGQPYIVQGMHPEAMAMQKMEQPFPCLSKQGIVDMGYSAIFPSTDGLVMVSEQGAHLISKGLWTREQWLAMQPTTIQAARFGQSYGFTFTPPAGGPARHIILIEQGGDQPAVLRASEQPAGLYTHIESGQTYLLSGNRRSVQAFDAPGAPKKSYHWRSKPWRLPHETSFGAIRIETHGEAGEVLSCRVYADGALLHTVTAANTNLRLPEGAYRDWQVEISGNATVISLAMGRTFMELND